MRVTLFLLVGVAILGVGGAVQAQDKRKKVLTENMTDFMSHSRWMARRYRDQNMVVGAKNQFIGIRSDRELLERRRDTRLRQASVAEHLAIAHPTAQQRRQALIDSTRKKPGVSSAPGSSSYAPLASSPLSTRRSRPYDPVRAEYLGEERP